MNFVVITCNTKFTNPVVIVNFFKVDAIVDTIVGVLLYRLKLLTLQAC